MLLKTIKVGEIETNCYLVIDKAGGVGVIIDAGADADRIIAVVETASVKVEKIILTHGHWDHISAVKTVAKATGAKTLIHQADAGMLKDPLRNLSLVVGNEEFAYQADELAVDAQKIGVGGLSINILHTPGHTPGSMSLLIEDSLFCGDLIFFGSVGRTDLPGSDPDQLHQSIHARVMTLPDETKIFPGHGASTTVGQEKSQNPYLLAGW